MFRGAFEYLLHLGRTHWTVLSCSWKQLTELMSNVWEYVNTHICCADLSNSSLITFTTSELSKQWAKIPPSSQFTLRLSIISVVEGKALFDTVRNYVIHKVLQQRKEVLYLKCIINSRTYVWTRRFYSVLFISVTLWNVKLGYPMNNCWVLMSYVFKQSVKSNCVTTEAGTSVTTKSTLG